MGSLSPLYTKIRFNRLRKCWVVQQWGETGESNTESDDDENSDDDVVIADLDEHSTVLTFVSDEQMDDVTVLTSSNCIKRSKYKPKKKRKQQKIKHKKWAKLKRLISYTKDQNGKGNSYISRSY